MDVSIELGNNKVTVKVLNNSKSRKTDSRRAAVSLALSIS